MTTLRDRIQSKIGRLQTRIGAIQADAAERIKPLQAELEVEQARLTRLAPWSNLDLPAAKAAMAAETAGYTQ